MILMKETFTFKVDTEEQVVNLINDEKAKTKGLVTYSTTFKTKKSKGEIIESWYVVAVTHDYTVE